MTSQEMDDKSHRHSTRSGNPTALNGYQQPISSPVPRPRRGWTPPLSFPHDTQVPSSVQPCGRSARGYLPGPYALEPSGGIVNPNTLESGPYTCYPDVLRSPNPLQPYGCSVLAYLSNPQLAYDVENPMERPSNCSPAPVPIPTSLLCFKPCIHCRLETLPRCPASRDTNGSQSWLAVTQCSARPRSTDVNSTFLSFKEVVSHLNKRGCPDLTDELDPVSYGDAPVNGGGLGDVYKGKLKDRTPVAIKVIRSANDLSGEAVQKHLKRATQELYVWWKCEHKNVQRLLGLVEFRPGQLGMVSPWEKHGNVKGYLRLNPTTDPCQISAQVTEGLSYLHQVGVVHGDLKAENILVSGDGTPMLADFGCSTLTREWTLPITSSTPAQGSLRWAAPEILNGENISRPPADVYALGMTILEMITGKLPWCELSNVAAVVTAVVVKAARPRRPLEVIPYNSKQGDNLWGLLEQCWLSEPTSRPTAAEVGAIMNDIKRNEL